MLLLDKRDGVLRCAGLLEYKLRLVSKIGSNCLSLIYWGKVDSISDAGLPPLPTSMVVKFEHVCAACEGMVSCLGSAPVSWHY